MKHLMMQALTRLSQAANHLGLFLVDDPTENSNETKRKNVIERNEMIFSGHEQYLVKDTAMYGLSQPELCAKMNILIKLLKAWKEEGSKVLLFSKSTK